MAEEVVVTKEAAGFLTAAVGGVMTIFYQARKIGRLEEQFDATKKQVAEAMAKIEQLEQDHARDMKDLASWFRTDSGGQKFVTFPDHDLICSRNSRATTQAMGQMTEAMRGVTTQVSILGEQIVQLKVAVAVLQQTKDAVKGTFEAGYFPPCPKIPS